VFDTGVSMTMTHALSDREDGGTHIEIRVAKPAPELMERFAQLTPLLEQSMQASGAALVEQLNDAAARFRAAQAAEPALPASAGRFVTQPVSH
jgi:hypothetical protein